MNTNKKNGILTKLLVALAVVVVLAILTPFIYMMVMLELVIPAKEKKVAKSYLSELKAIELPQGTTLIDEYSGTGNLFADQMTECVGAILVKSDLTAQELDDYYAAYRDPQNEGDKIVTDDAKYILSSLDTSVEIRDDIDDGSYYLVYSWKEID